MTPHRASALLLVASLSVGCMGHARIRYIHPADIALPEQIQVVAPINRTANSSSGPTMDAFVDTLAASPRVKVTDPTIAQAAAERHGGQVGQPLTPESVVAICKDSSSTGVMALESFGLDEQWSINTHEESRTETVETRVEGSDKTRTSEVTKTVVVYDARIEVKADSLWRTYDCSGRRFDELPVQVQELALGSGDSEADARTAAGSSAELRESAAEQIGITYAHHVAPYEIEADRRFYKRGNASMKEGAAALKKGDWKKAREQYEKAARAEKEKVRGKALFNLALCEEQANELEPAFDHARQANKILDNKKSTSYLETLKKRKKAERKLNLQLPVEKAAEKPASEVK